MLRSYRTSCISHGRNARFGTRVTSVSGMACEALTCPLRITQRELKQSSLELTRVRPPNRPCQMSLRNAVEGGGLEERGAVHHSAAGDDQAEFDGGVDVDFGGTIPDRSNPASLLKPRISTLPKMKLLHRHIQTPPYLPPLSTASRASQPSCASKSGVSPPLRSPPRPASPSASFRKTPPTMASSSKPEAPRCSLPAVRPDRLR